MHHEIMVDRPRLLLRQPRHVHHSTLPGPSITMQSTSSQGAIDFDNLAIDFARTRRRLRQSRDQRRTKATKTSRTMNARSMEVDVPVQEGDFEVVSKRNAGQSSTRNLTGNRKPRLRSVVCSFLYCGKCCGMLILPDATQWYAAGSDLNCSWPALPRYSWSQSNFFSTTATSDVSAECTSIKCATA